MELIFAGLTLGFLGSFHCIGMCGPIALSLPLGSANKFQRITGGITYNLGRVVTYALLGSLFGLLGQGFIIAGYQQALSIILGLALLLIMVIPSSQTQKISLTKIMFPFVSKVKSLLRTLFQQKSLASLFSIGLLNGLLPCGMVYLAVAGAIATGESGKGSLFMAAFGFGTLPAMVLVVWASQWIGITVRSKMRRVVPVFAVTMACILILRGLNLGIPYLSPELDKTDCRKATCCHHQ